MTNLNKFYSGINRISEEKKSEELDDDSNSLSLQEIEEMIAPVLQNNNNQDFDTPVKDYNEESNLPIR